MKFIDNYIKGTKKSFRRMPRMTAISVLSDAAIVGSLTRIIYTWDFDWKDAVALGAAALGFIATRNYLFELNRFDDHMRRFVRDKNIGESFLESQEFTKEARDYASRYKIHDFELYLKRNFRR